MSTHPYIPLYVDDYDAATAHLTVEEDGVYSRLIRLAWRTPGCCLPNDPAWIARKIRVASGDIDRILAPVLTEFFTVQRGRLIQRRLKREYDDISRKKTARQLAGKKGGEAKARKTKDNPASNATDLSPHTRAFHTQNQNQNQKEERVEATQRLRLAEVGSEAASPKRGCRLSADWRPSADLVAFAMGEGFTEREADLIAAKFRDFWTAKPGKDGVKLDWPATWRNWVRNEADRRGVHGASPRPQRVTFV